MEFAIDILKDQLHETRIFQYSNKTKLDESTFKIRVDSLEKGIKTLEDEVNKNITEPPECTICGKPFFSVKCLGCGYTDKNN